jgi:hypothetical protein
VVRGQLFCFPPPHFTETPKHRPSPSPASPGPSAFATFLAGEAIAKTAAAFRGNSRSSGRRLLWLKNFGIHLFASVKAFAPSHLCVFALKPFPIPHPCFPWSKISSLPLSAASVASVLIRELASIRDHVSRQRTASLGTRLVAGLGSQIRVKTRSVLSGNVKLDQICAFPPFTLTVFGGLLP